MAATAETAIVGRAGAERTGPTRLSGRALLVTADLEAITADAALGDPAALRAIYDILAPRVFGYLRARGADDPEALTNDVFVAVIPRLRDLTGGWEGLRTLVFSIAHARMVDDVRRRQRRPAHQEYDPADDPRTHLSAEHQAMDRVASQELIEVLELLPHDQRSVVVMRVLGDLSISQTATAIGRSEPAVKKLQAKALAALRNLLGPGEANTSKDVGTSG